MKSTRIIFFGTSDRSLPILESLKNNFELYLCITKKDSKVGRSQILKETQVKKWARENNIKFLEVNSLKNDDLHIIVEAIKKIKPDYGIVADFSFIIPKDIIDTFEGKIINIHFSLLPKYRGASPVQFALLNNDKMTGITYYLLDEKMDTGKIIKQIEYKIDTKVTSGELYDQLFNIAAEKLPETLEDFQSGRINPTPQDESKASYTFSRTNPKHTFIFKKDAQINWSDSPERIECAIRAYYPWPVAWSYVKDIESATCLTQNISFKDYVNKDLKIKIYKSALIDGNLQIKEIQVEGRNKLNWEEFKNGYLK